MLVESSFTSLVLDAIILGASAGVALAVVTELDVESRYLEIGVFFGIFSATLVGVTTLVKVCGTVGARRWGRPYAKLRSHGIDSDPDSTEYEMKSLNSADDVYESVDLLSNL